MSSEKHGVVGVSRKPAQKGEQAKLLRTFRVPDEVTLQAVTHLYRSLDCPRSLTCALLLKYKEYDQLVSMEIDPLHYNHASEFRDAFQATKLLSKNDFLKLSLDRKEVALAKFSEMEDRCKATNARFRALMLDPLYKGPNVSLLHAMTLKIMKVLGEFQCEEMLDLANWGPGVTTLLKGDSVSATNKFQCETGITRDLFALMPNEYLRYAYPRWEELLRSNGAFPTFEVGNVIITVPKNAKTDRVIAVEPGLNLWFQKGLGAMIRRRLQRYGIDLNSQERNQRLAKVGSKDSSLATVDFSSASDSISSVLIREVLPPDWFAVLDACRSHYGKSKQGSIRWNKFSSMGNGFTFELESLIFYCAAASVCEYLGVSAQSVSVYGDDVIIPTECFELFSSFSAFLGFEVNLKKSYSSSLFRESCGSYYFDGVDVKPIYVREIASKPLQVFRLANAIRRSAHNRVARLGCDRRYYGVWKFLVDCLPKPLRFRIDETLGDGGFISNFDEAAPSRARHGHEGFVVMHAVELGLTAESEEDGQLLAHLRKSSTQGIWTTNTLKSRTLLLPGGTSVRLMTKVVSPAVSKRALEQGNTYSLRARVKIRLVKSTVSRWTDLGPWF